MNEITLTTFWLSILLLKAFCLGVWAAWTYDAYTGDMAYKDGVYKLDEVKERMEANRKATESLGKLHRKTSLHKRKS